MLTNILIGVVVIGAVYYLFGGSFRKRISEPEDMHSDSEHSGHHGGGCCGGGGHSKHKHHGKKQAKAVDAWIDPVCGMPVETDDAVATKRYKGHTYYFCSEQCHQAFAQSPAKYAKKQEPVRQPSQGGGHGCCG